MTFKKRSSGGMKTGLCGLSDRKKKLRSLRIRCDSVLKSSCVADKSREKARDQESLCTLGVAEALIMLKESVRREKSPVIDLVWPSPTSAPFVVTPVKHNTGNETLNRAEAKRKYSRNIFMEIENDNSRDSMLKSSCPADESSEKAKDEELLCTLGVAEALVMLQESVRREKFPVIDRAEAMDKISSRNIFMDFENIEYLKNSGRGDNVDVLEGEGCPEHEDSLVTTEVPYTKSTSTQTDFLSYPSKIIWAAKWSYDSMKSVTRKVFRRLTGLTQGNFQCLYTFLGGDEVCARLKYNYRSGTPKTLKSHLQPKDRLSLTLLRLRRGFGVEDIALLFGVSMAHVSGIIFVWIQLLYLQFTRMKSAMCITRHDQKKQKLPPCFLPFKNFRMVLDLTEVRIETPYHYQQQGNTYSSYKAGNVILYLIGCTAFGSISFISGGYEGAISDRKLFKASKIEEFLEPGDLLLVDRGFHVKDLVDSAKIKVLHPPFLGKRERLSPEEELQFKMISHARVHIERAIRKIKCFHILKCVTNKMLSTLDQIVYICGCLVNFDPNNIIVQ